MPTLAVVGAGPKGIAIAAKARALEAAGLGPMPVTVFGENRDGSPYPRPRQMALATDRVRYVGDPVAMVIAGPLRFSR